MDDSPWPSERLPMVKILDCKEGWIRYAFRGHLFQDERMELDRFLAIYKRAKTITFHGMETRLKNNWWEVKTEKGWVKYQVVADARRYNASTQAHIK